MKWTANFNKYITVGEFINLLQMYDSNRIVYFEYENGEEPLEVYINTSDEFSYALTINLKDNIM